MSKRNQQRIKSHRETAYFAQHGRCYYCTAPMWLYVPEELTEPLGVKPGQAVGFPSSCHFRSFMLSPTQ